MTDITMCAPKKLNKRCQSCYRHNAKPDTWQSFSDFSDECDDYYMEERGLRGRSKNKSSDRK